MFCVCIYANEVLYVYVHKVCCITEANIDQVPKQSWIKRRWIGFSTFLKHLLTRESYIPVNIDNLDRVSDAEPLLSAEKCLNEQNYDRDSSVIRNSIKAGAINSASIDIVGSTTSQLVSVSDCVSASVVMPQSAAEIQNLQPTIALPDETTSASCDLQAWLLATGESQGQQTYAHSVMSDCSSVTVDTVDSKCRSDRNRRKPLLVNTISHLHGISNVSEQHISGRSSHRGQSLSSFGEGLLP